MVRRMAHDLVFSATDSMSAGGYLRCEECDDGVVIPAGAPASISWELEMLHKRSHAQAILADAFLVAATALRETGDLQAFRIAEQAAEAAYGEMMRS